MRETYALILGLALLSGTAEADALRPIQPVPHVDLPRFMGKWYLIAAVPTEYERDAWNAVETYALQPDGNILTTFRFNKGAPDGPVKQIHSTGYVRPGSNGAVWGVQIFWPLKAQYIVAWLKPDYSEMIVARDARDYTWVFARTPSVTAPDWSSLQTQVSALGYDLSKLRKIPQPGFSDAPHQERRKVYGARSTKNRGHLFLRYSEVRHGSKTDVSRI